MDDIITQNLRGFEIKFKTRPGVFSRQGLDLGSRLLIDNMKVENGSMVADLGCGSGVIGFVAAKLNPKGHVHLLDVNLRTVELATNNVDLNNFKNVEVFLSDLFSAVCDRTYHLILSNPVQHSGNEFLEESARECFKHLKSGGVVYWVIQKHVTPLIKRLFEKYFSNYEVVAHGKMHSVIKAEKK